ncbi:hypothetical protein HDV05_007677 [Chytridiales sp. JEL 0842]|nr:hypothetical protein HDV05_007677 [Chytridiales sp. JEL 0842]
MATYKRRQRGLVARNTSFSSSASSDFEERCSAFNIIKQQHQDTMEASTVPYTDEVDSSETVLSPTKSESSTTERKKRRITSMKVSVRHNAQSTAQSAQASTSTSASTTTNAIARAEGSPMKGARSSVAPSPQKGTLREEQQDDEIARPTVAVTYGKTRSFLASEQEGNREGYVALAKRHREEGLESSDEEERRDLRTSHELRQSGESKRFSDEMEYLLAGLSANQPVNVLRTSALELCKKVKCPKLLGKIRTHSYLPRVYESISIHGDWDEQFDVLHTLIAILLACIVSNHKGNQNQLKNLLDDSDLLNLAKDLKIEQDKFCQELAKEEGDPDNAATTNLLQWFEDTIATVESL